MISLPDCTSHSTMSTQNPTLTKTKTHFSATYSPTSSPRDELPSQLPSTLLNAFGPAICGPLTLPSSTQLLCESSVESLLTGSFQQKPINEDATLTCMMMNRETTDDCMHFITSTDQKTIT